MDSDDEDVVMPAGVRALINTVGFQDFHTLKELVFWWCDQHSRDIFAQEHWRASRVALDHQAIFGERNDRATMAAAQDALSEWLGFTVVPSHIVLQYVSCVPDTRTHIYAVTMAS